MKLDFKTAGFARKPDANEPAWLQNLRSEAAKNFDNLGIPHTKMEDWRFTNLKSFAETDFRGAGDVAPDTVKELISGCKLPDIDHYAIVNVNGSYRDDISDVADMPKGVVLMRLHDALADEDQIAKKLFNTGLKTDEYAFQALNTANFENGVFLHVEKDVEVDKPIVIYNLSVSEGEATISFPRNLFVFEENCQATLIELTKGTGSYCLNPVNETILRRHAKIRRYGVMRDSSDAWFFGTAATVQEDESDYKSINVILGSKLYRNDMFVELDGNDITSSINAVYHLTDDRQTDNFTRVRHLGLNSESTQIFKGILDDSSRGVFDGRIFVKEGAQKTDAVQTNRNLLLCDDAVSYAKPQLEIYADDVKCTHGATTGQLDEEMLFYLLSRGYDVKAAKAELTYAFAAELIDEIAIEPLRDLLREELYQLLSSRA